MKVKIGPYVDWIGPYQIAEKILFWMDKYEDRRVHNFGRWLSENRHGEDSLLTKVCQWIHDKQKRTIKVKIDDYDTWSMDRTLAYIILPMLIQLKDKNHGAPCTDDEDVPEELKSTSAPPKENEYDVDENHFKRWDWVMDEIIWTFEQLVDECSEDKFHDGESQILWQPFDKDGNKIGEPVRLQDKNDNESVSHYELVKGPNDTFTVDREGLTAHNARIDNGLRLFGKYYRGLWD